MDSLLAQSQKEYSSLLNRLNKVLRQRQSALEALREGQNLALEGFNNQLIELGVLISVYRSRLVDQLVPIYEKALSTLAPKSKSEIKLINKSFINQGSRSLKDYKLAYQEAIQETQPREVQAARNLIGPHREDLDIYLNDNPIKDFGSRGEWRSCILALKRSEIDYLEKNTGERPVLLLDDVLSELDTNRRGALIEWISEQQTIITTADQNELPTKLQNKAKTIHVDQGKLTLKSKSFALD